MEYKDILQVADAWVRQAGELARKRFGSAVASRKEDQSIVTDVDHAVQAVLLDAIGREFPGDAVICEEELSEPHRHAEINTAQRCWIVDPIDGTRNYARNFPSFSVSVGVMEKGRPVIGMVYQPMTGQMYSAAAGQGAWLDGEDIKIRQTDGRVSHRALIAMPSVEKALPPSVHRWIDRCVFRNLGSTALHLGLLAAGAIDAVYSNRCRLWDIAAGVIIAEQAGARTISAIDGREFFPMDLENYAAEEMTFLAAGPQLLSRLWEEFRQDQSAG